MEVLWILLAIVVLVVVFVIAVYNNLVMRRNRVKEAASDIVVYWPSACSRSSMMSCTSSRPTEIRTVPSLMPSLARYPRAFA